LSRYHDSSDRPDNALADVVRTSVAKIDAPDFDMQTDTSFDFADSGSSMQPAPHDATAAPTIAPDDRQRC